MTDNKPPLKGRGQSHMTRFQFWRLQSYIGYGWSESHQILYAGRIYQVLAFGWQTTPSGHGQGHTTCFF